MSAAPAMCRSAVPWSSVQDHDHVGTGGRPRRLGVIACPGRRRDHHQDAGDPERLAARLAIAVTPRGDDRPRGLDPDLTAAVVARDPPGRMRAVPSAQRMSGAWDRPLLPSRDREGAGTTAEAPHTAPSRSRLGSTHDPAAASGRPSVRALWTIRTRGRRIARASPPSGPPTGPDERQPARVVGGAATPAGVAPLRQRGRPWGPSASGTGHPDGNGGASAYSRSGARSAPTPSSWTGARSRSSRSSGPSRTRRSS